MSTGVASPRHPSWMLTLLHLVLGDVPLFHLSCRSLLINSYSLPIPQYSSVRVLYFFITSYILKDQTGDEGGGEDRRSGGSGNPASRVSTETKSRICTRVGYIQRLYHKLETVFITLPISSSQCGDLFRG